jgi:DNA-binding PadR family transcriptional regulator
MKMTPTGWTILGFLALHPRNGYQLRQAAQRSVGHFWGVSYGQLYPQLKVLEEGGFIVSEDAAAAAAVDGGRQTAWRLTEQGAEALAGWLDTPAQPVQLRDESLVKLLFSDHAGVDVMRRLIAERREKAQERRDRAEATIPGAHWPSDTSKSAGTPLAAWLVRGHTLALADAELAWCDEAVAMITQHLNGQEKL